MRLARSVGRFVCLMSLEERFLGKHIRGFLPTWRVCLQIEGVTQVDGGDVYQRVMELAHQCDIAPQTAAERVLHHVKRMCSLKLACQLVEEEYVKQPDERGQHSERPKRRSRAES